MQRTTEIVEICVTEQKQSRDKHEEACAWIFHFGFTRNGAVATEMSCMRIEQSSPPGSNAHDAEAVGLPQETSDLK